MNKKFSLLMAAVMAAGIVAFAGMGAKAEAQGVTSVGLRLGYNYVEYEYEYFDYRYYYTSDFGFHLGVQADIAIAEIDLGGDAATFGLNPLVQLTSKGGTSKLPNGVEYKLDAYYLEIPVPFAFKWNYGRTSAIIFEIGPFASIFLGGEEKLENPFNLAITANDVTAKVNFDAGIMAGILWEFNRQFVFGLRLMSGFLEDDNYNYWYVTFGYNFWRS